LINSILNPDDILPVRGIPKFVIAKEAVTAPWLLSILLIPGICVIAFESVVNVILTLFEAYSNLK
jgi:hypothetical protein